MKSTKPWFWTPVVPLVVFDLWSKAAVFAFMDEWKPNQDLMRQYEVWDWEPLSFHLVTWYNTGTIWGIGRGATDFLIGLRCVAVALIVYFAWKLPARARARQLVLGMILAGAIGNLYDNFTQPNGGVRDFLLFTGSWFGGWTFPAFNVADSCICVGAFTLAFLLWSGVEEETIGS